MCGDSAYSIIAVSAGLLAFDNIINLNAIDFKVRQFYHIPEGDPGLRRAKVEHYFKHVYHSNAMEGNTLTLAQTRSILETRLAVGGKSLLEQNEVTH
ncbi:unnamed protein product [Trichobilharzia regenti]|nr:unnamed protein product [Trichobilharzia regenti]